MLFSEDRVVPIVEFLVSSLLNRLARSREKKGCVDGDTVRRGRKRPCEEQRYHHTADQQERLIITTIYAFSIVTASHVRILFPCLVRGAP